MILCVFIINEKLQYMKQKKQKGIPQLYIPITMSRNKNNSSVKYTGGVSPKNIEFSIGKISLRCHNKSSQNKERSDSNNSGFLFKKQKRFQRKQHLSENKRLFKDDKDSIDKKKISEQQRFSLSRMIQQSSKKQGYQWHKIYGFYTKQIRNHKNIKKYSIVTQKQQNPQEKNSKQLKRILNVKEYRPALISQRYAKTADDRCRCHTKSKPDSKCVIRTKFHCFNPQKNHQFYSIDSPDQKMNDKKQIFNGRGRQMWRQKGRTSQIRTINLTENWAVDSWKTGKLIESSDFIF